ncbi:hypothetical protein DEU56DRAFT_754936 [Suillus clintonianus]|uniref:uncharacterized protein n=1 Tax=Suillus clintonianus TaxID=1904413 RepID=UPI001B86CEE7|nr:uncharacterized protein DEU56DRAFT_754936 [Suillus clintonianus]KAG2141213.1 hypothetical protein DEU56DRAFT_754936 [Suillus clintonianus]
MKNSTAFKNVMQKHSSVGKLHLSKAIVNMALELRSCSELPAFCNKYPSGNRSTGQSELHDKWTRGYTVGVDSSNEDGGNKGSGDEGTNDGDEDVSMESTGLSKI